ncbi:hypothetical protein [Enterobacter phage vB_ExiM_F5M1E]|nr:hypothetical protein [Enterobacter phage vB_ExiM_F1M1E]UNA03216.1 hypothetical protein [Enterobacter phage vB_ExiM_F2M1E]UNA03536.1 hypothetical protein [Enterobacter phage vB_ExiM_F4M1E]UNA03857.1 hypothetical protein [Enterobacter phage vB_ExiM_F5M1E]UNA04177.1 hypothetical protein [Pantoea phage vB_PdiM_F5M2A]
MKNFKFKVLTRGSLDHRMHTSKRDNRMRVIEC